MLLWDESARGLIWAIMVVESNPLGGEVLNLFNIGPAILRQPLVANGPIEPLDISVLMWLAGLNVFKPDAPLGGPFLNAADFSWPVVAANYLRFAAPRNDLL